MLSKYKIHQGSYHGRKYYQGGKCIKVENVVEVTKKYHQGRETLDQGGK